MPPDLQGHTWIRVSKACASRGLPRRRASFVRAAPRGFSACTRDFSARKCATLALGITILLVLTILDSAFDSARADARSLPRSVFASTATGANSDGGPSGFGESNALERSRLRKSSGRYSSANDGLLHASSVVQMMAMPTFFRTIRGLLKCSKHGITLHLGSEMRNSSQYFCQGYRAPRGREMPLFRATHKPMIS